MALARGAAASAEPEQLATRSFIAVLEQLLEGRASISRHEWMTYEPAAGSFTAEQATLIIGILSEILENEAAVKGMLEMFRSEIVKGLTPSTTAMPAAEFSALMRDLFTVLDTDHSGTLGQEELRAFISALARGSEGLGRQESEAIQVFVRLLERLVAGRTATPLDEWLAFQFPEGSCSDQQVQVFVRIIREIIEDESAIKGLLSAVKQ
eukprot:CAMPEP_0181170102 /NCGR_PEP_ID=MMETSP1096-20121128/1177_1 /TAXON_ID=156174 ORGANISM="Chrysochromulina ericina, Strain CCMP281" /NCGR_SAMPLE_ID=MMETSP1096 /ASSEMBLY_ACC=CAM_ASM_000453 /LENGTH=208 /DNA_ID=CAMNT_0023257621 /DNA_START=5 /DNA_END=631 /DNA_ORIENTATION=-